MRPDNADRESDHQITVPSADAGWRQIWEFALTYNAYDRHGGFEGAAEIGNRCKDSWNSSAELPDDLQTTRAALFFEQRRWRHFGHDPDEQAGAYIRALLARIGELSGGAVPGPSDDFP